MAMTVIAKKGRARRMLEETDKPRPAKLDGVA